jgi:NAD(P)-dependent dehydrogenase (short-subunit alcohol dehydrogenase family)
MTPMRVLITGSADGLGLMTASHLAARGHLVTLHARSEERAREALSAVPRAAAVLVGDVETLAGMRAVAEQANARGDLDAVIHNVAVGYREPRRRTTTDGLEHVFATNVLAPYVLTALVNRPKRLVYLSSGMHRSGSPHLTDPQWERRAWNGAQAYADSKFLDVVLAFAVARRWPGTLSNALEPGWVPTNMGGPEAPDDLSLAHLTQAWLAEGLEPATRTTAGYFYHQRPCEVHPATRELALQEELLDYCAELSGVTLPSL